jgi:hypothetical protein
MSKHINAALIACACLFSLAGTARSQQVVTIRNQRSGMVLTAQGQ